MSKVSMDSVIDALNMAGIEGGPRKLLLQKLEMLMEEEKAEKMADGPKKRQKNQLVVVLKTLDNININNVAASVFQIPEDTDPNTLMDTLRKSAVDSNIANSGKKKSKNLISFSNIIAFLKPKFQKPNGIKILTKEMVAIQVITPEKDDSFISVRLADKENFD